jgi:ketosteroid isomerase-like protein
MTSESGPSREPLMLELNIPEVIAEVTEAFACYERALVANDVAELDMLFWNSPHTLRFGIGENLYGYDAIAAFRNGRLPIDLTRRLKNTVIVSYGRDLATANTEFQREGSKFAGRQSHVWLRTEAGWRIAAAHVSLMPVPQPNAATRPPLNESVPNMP